MELPTGAVEGAPHASRTLAATPEGLPGDAIHPRLDGRDQGIHDIFITDGFPQKSALFTKNTQCRHIPLPVYRNIVTCLLSTKPSS